jgi:aspartate racemase
MSWESSAVYYQRINQGVAARLGGLHSAPCLLWSFDFAPIAELQNAGEWQQAGKLMADAARRLEQAGAEGIVLCTNTMHKVAEEIERAISVPFIHVADVTGRAIQAAGIRRVLLLATGFTMEQAFYRDWLEQRYGLEVWVPEAADRAEVHRVIYEELCCGKIVDSSRERYRAIIEAHLAQGVEGVILGCTEISLLLPPAELAVPAFDTTALHAAAAVEFVLTD